ncbi:hypothetical protein NMG60_11016822 [Bertholletia excelsa]
MKGRESKGPPSADLLVCFPSRAHLTLMPKPLCSPARPPESAKRHHRPRHHHHLRNLSNRGGQASPLLWAKPRAMGPDISEPTSPKVTCAGQIKVRPRSSAGKNWQSVMEEIERLHTNRKHKKRATWAEAFGFKKDTLQFLSCLRRLRFDFRCFGAFPTSDDEDDDGDDDEDEAHVVTEGIDGNDGSRTVFSKWFMVLQEHNNNKRQSKECENCIREEPVAPPPNALVLMRCRSAPTKTWLEERGEEDENEDEDEDEKRGKEHERREKKSKSLAVVMQCDTDFFKLSSDIAKETWVVGGVRDPLSRSRSWKR